MNTQLKNVAQVFTGTTPPTNEQRYYESEDIEWFSPGDIMSDNINIKESNRKISKLYFQEKNFHPFPQKSVLMVGIGATVGKVAYSDSACWSNQQINVIVFDKKKILPKFGAYQLLNKGREISKKTPVVTLQIFNQSKVRQIELWVPSLADQHRMVTYLDTKLSEIDHQVSLLTSKRDAYLRLKKSIINHAVTRGLNPNVKMKDSGIEWIGEVPEHWEVKRMKDYSNIIAGQAPAGEDVKEEGIIPFMQGKSEFTNKYPITKLFCETCTKHSRVGDILMSVRAPIGDINISDKVYGIGRGLCAIKSHNIDATFLWYFFMNSKEYINSLGTGSTFLAITAEDIKGMPIIIPPLPEQRTIATYLDDTCAKIDTIVSNLDKQISRYADLKRSLIDEVITGKRAV